MKSMLPRKHENPPLLHEPVKLPIYDCHDTKRRQAIPSTLYDAPDASNNAASHSWTRGWERKHLALVCEWNI